jgi:hypothetical protein
MGGAAEGPRPAFGIELARLAALFYSLHLNRARLLFSIRSRSARPVRVDANCGFEGSRRSEAWSQ